jgi:tetratricopeptide (TPR) repeat protein
MRLIFFRAIWIPLLALAAVTQPAGAQRDVTAGQRSRDAIAQDAQNALVDAANRVNSVDPTDPVKRANNRMARGEGGPTLTPAVARALSLAKQHMEAGNADRALEAVQVARRGAIRPSDKLKVFQFLALIHLHLRDEAGAAIAAEAAADMPSLPDSEKKSVYTSAALLALNARHYDKALRYARAMQDLRMDDAQSQLIIGQALYFGGDRDGAIDIIRKQIDLAVAAGKKPDRAMLEMILSAQVQSQSHDEAQATLDLLKRHYEDPRNWQQIIELMRQLDIWDAHNRANDPELRRLQPSGT